MLGGPPLPLPPPAPLGPGRSVRRGLPPPSPQPGVQSLSPPPFQTGLGGGGNCGGLKRGGGWVKAGRQVLALMSSGCTSRGGCSLGAPPPHSVPCPNLPSVGGPPSSSDQVLPLSTASNNFLFSTGVAWGWSQQRSVVSGATSRMLWLDKSLSQNNVPLFFGEASRILKRAYGGKKSIRRKTRRHKPGRSQIFAKKTCVPVESKPVALSRRPAVQSRAPPTRTTRGPSSSTAVPPRPPPHPPRPPPRTPRTPPPSRSTALSPGSHGRSRYAAQHWFVWGGNWTDT